MKKAYVLFCAECGSPDLSVGYYEDLGGPLVFETECNTCGAAGRLEGLSIASLRVRAEKVDDLMIEAVMAKHVAVGPADRPLIRKFCDGHRKTLKLGSLVNQLKH